MDELWLVGVGMGALAHLTLEGRRALREAGLILLPHKGAEKGRLAELRREILIGCGATAPVAEFDMPERDPALPYLERVARWHDEIAARWQRAVDASGAPNGPVALMVWGDPSLYDSTLRIARRLDPAPSLRAIPGITALQALTAAHAIPLNEVNGPVTITTGRQLRDHGWPDGARRVAVMLDGACSFDRLYGRGLEIWWGANLGLPEETLDAGPLDAAGPRIVALREALRGEQGWIMDTYLLGFPD
ncbi:precorrin-6A synthase (deacetylating) [Poseidonocella sedimentorum]|uniref:Precorrin-6A synthase [deacetylating] n=1 Tax=Poseidonocella sedimentorum TaxID=871652 RepID=A0A1I6EJQ5_9RHOB|nr:precorrin-6A synthase (deacetylating) [Poseidonocella sedimentorum]SFR17989.1 precorrin-6A synthase (deacetylating) [Poseidonocella sedimentorum]